MYKAKIKCEKKIQAKMKRGGGAQITSPGSDIGSVILFFFFGSMHKMLSFLLDDASSQGVYEKRKLLFSKNL